jgi:hypothetical protein
MSKRRGRETQLVKPAGLGDSEPHGRAWELVRIAYESHFELAQHYSSVMFQARIAITTVMVVAVALGFGFLPRGDSSSIEFAGVPARGLVAYVAALLVNLLHAMEVTYVVRFYRIMQSGRRIEREYNAPVYFADYERADSWPLYFAYLGGILVLVALFLGAAWTPQQGAARSAVLMIVGALPAAVFIRSYVLLVRAGRKLFEESVP